MTLKDKFKQWFINDEEDEHYEGMVEAVSIEHEKIADEYAIQFALFLSTECETSGSRDGWWFYKKHWKTTNEMLEQFKKEKGL